MVFAVHGAPVTRRAVALVGHEELAAGERRGQAHDQRAELTLRARRVAVPREVAAGAVEVEVVEHGADALGVRHELRRDLREDVVRQQILDALEPVGRDVARDADLVVELRLAAVAERRRLRGGQQRRERRVLRAARLRQGHAGVAAREREAVEGEAAVYLVPRLDAVDGVAERLQRVKCRHGCFHGCSR